MPQVQEFDAIVVGAGQAGPALAGRLTQAGMSVAVIERHWFGGTCVNTGCMPTKTLVASAAIARHAQRAREFGIKIDGKVSIDMSAVKARKDKIVHTSRANIEKWLHGMPRCSVFCGHARFVGAREIQIDAGVTLRASRIFLNVGGRAAIPALPGVDRIPYLTNTSILQLDCVPPHLVIVGGSYVGVLSFSVQ